MKLMTRFSLSHSGVVVMSLLVSFFLIYEGSRLLYQRQEKVNQAQEISDFALAAKESLIQHEDVAVLNFMKSAVNNPLVAYAAYSNPSTGTHVVLPMEFQKEVFTSGNEKSGISNSPLRRRFKNGMETLEWTESIHLESGMTGRVWLGFSQAALEKDLGEQTAKWMRLELEAGAAALVIGLLVSLWLGRQMALPLRKIRDGTHLVRSG